MVSVSNYSNFYKKSPTPSCGERDVASGGFLIVLQLVFPDFKTPREVLLVAAVWVVGPCLRVASQTVALFKIAELVVEHGHVEHGSGELMMCVSPARFRVP